MVHAPVFGWHSWDVADSGCKPGDIPRFKGAPSTTTWASGAIRCARCRNLLQPSYSGSMACASCAEAALKDSEVMDDAQPPPMTLFTPSISPASSFTDSPRSSCSMRRCEPRNCFDNPRTCCAQRTTTAQQAKPKRRDRALPARSQASTAAIEPLRRCASHSAYEIACRGRHAGGLGVRAAACAWRPGTVGTRTRNTVRESTVGGRASSGRADTE